MRLGASAEGAANIESARVLRLSASAACAGTSPRLCALGPSHLVVLALSRKKTSTKRPF
jgi:hypothetical protein